MDSSLSKHVHINRIPWPDGLVQQFQIKSALLHYGYDLILVLAGLNLNRRALIIKGNEWGGV